MPIIGLLLLFACNIVKSLSKNVVHVDMQTIPRLLNTYPQVVLSFYPINYYCPECAVHLKAFGNAVNETSIARPAVFFGTSSLPRIKHPYIAFFANGQRIEPSFMGLVDKFAMKKWLSEKLGIGKSEVLKYEKPKVLNQKYIQVAKDPKQNRLILSLDLNTTFNPDETENLAKWIADYTAINRVHKVDEVDTMSSGNLDKSVTAAKSPLDMTGLPVSGDTESDQTTDSDLTTMAGNENVAGALTPGVGGSENIAGVQAQPAINALTPAVGTGENGGGAQAQPANNALTPGVAGSENGVGAQVQPASNALATAVGGVETGVNAHAQPTINAVGGVETGVNAQAQPTINAVGGVENGANAQAQPTINVVGGVETGVNAQVQPTINAVEGGENGVGAQAQPVSNALTPAVGGAENVVSAQAQPASNALTPGVGGGENVIDANVELVANDSVPVVESSPSTPAGTSQNVGIVTEVENADNPRAETAKQMDNTFTRIVGFAPVEEDCSCSNEDSLSYLDDGDETRELREISRHKRRKARRKSMRHHNHHRKSPDETRTLFDSMYR